MQTQIRTIRPLLKSLLASAALAMALGMPLNTASACDGKSCAHTKAAGKDGKVAKCSCPCGSKSKGKDHSCSKDSCADQKCTDKECCHHKEHAKGGAKESAPADEHKDH